jgi:hypothetical protein
MQSSGVLVTRSGIAPEALISFTASASSCALRPSNRSCPALCFRPEKLFPFHQNWWLSQNFQRLFVWKRRFSNLATSISGPYSARRLPIGLRNRVISYAKMYDIDHCKWTNTRQYWVCESSICAYHGVSRIKNCDHNKKLGLQLASLKRYLHFQSLSFVSCIIRFTKSLCLKTSP